MNDIPDDLAGYQCIEHGYVEPGDVFVYRIDRTKAFAIPIQHGLSIHNLSHHDVYRKMACPKAGDHDKGWREIRKTAEESASHRARLNAFSTGSLRENKVGKGRFDLIPYEPLRQLAVHFEDGGVKHGDRNWELGQPLSTYLSAGKRHAAQVGCKFDENHAISSCWNFFCFLQTVKWIEEGKLPKELDDVGWTKQNK